MVRGNPVWYPAAHALETLLPCISLRCCRWAIIPVALFGKPFVSRLSPFILLDLVMHRILRYPLGTPPCGAHLVIVLLALMPALVPL